MNAPLMGTNGQDRRAHQRTSQIKEVIEMKLVNLSKQLNIKVSRFLNTKTPAKLLGGIALGAMLMTATALPMGSVHEDDSGSPLASAGFVSNDEFAFEGSLSDS